MSESPRPHSPLVWQAGIVDDAGPGAVTVRFDRLAACQRCLEGNGCGAGVFSRLFARRHACLVLNTPLACREGEAVRVGISQRALLASAVMIYAGPLLAFFIGALLGHHLAPAETARDAFALFGGVGLAVAWLVVLRSARWARVEPVVERMPGQAEATLESGQP